MNAVPPNGGSEPDGYDGTGSPSSQDESETANKLDASADRLIEYWTGPWPELHEEYVPSDPADEGRYHVKISLLGEVTILQEPVYEPDSDFWRDSFGQQADWALGTFFVGELTIASILFSSAEKSAPPAAAVLALLGIGLVIASRVHLKATLGDWVLSGWWTAGEAHEFIVALIYTLIIAIITSVFVSAPELPAFFTFIAYQSSTFYLFLVKLAEGLGIVVSTSLFWVRVTLSVVIAVLFYMQLQIVKYGEAYFEMTF